MSIAFDGTQRARIAGSQPITCPDPCSVFCWVYFPTGWGTDAYGGICQTLNFGVTPGGWSVGRESTLSQVRLQVGHTSSSTTTQSLGLHSVSDNTLHSFGFRLRNSGGITLRGFFDGTPGTEDTSFSWGTIAEDIWCGEAPDGSNTAVRLMEVAVWDRLLDLADFAALANGLSPLWFPRGLTIYAPFKRHDQPEFVSKRTITLTNSPTTAAHFRVVDPYRGTVAKFSEGAAAEPGPTAGSHGVVRRWSTISGGQRRVSMGR